MPEAFNKTIEWVLPKTFGLHMIFEKSPLTAFNVWRNGAYCIAISFVSAGSSGAIATTAALIAGRTPVRKLRIIVRPS